MFMTAVSTASVGARSGTLSVIGPRPRIWCSAGTGLFAHGCASPAPPSSTRLSRWPSGSSKSSVSRPSRSAISPCFTRCSARCAFHQSSVFAPGDAKRGAGDRMRAAPLRRRRPVEEGDVGAGRREAVGVEQMIGADVVLVDGLLDQPHAEHALVEAAVAGRVGRNRGQMMDAFELHVALCPLEAPRCVWLAT